MKTLILFIASMAAVFSQGFRLNPITGQLDLVGGYTAPSGYSATVTAQTTTTVTAASHGQGTAPVAYCFDNASPANAVSCAYTVSSIGDVVFTWSPAFTGSVIIRGPGADAGAAGNVVGPASSTAGAVAFYSGTSGKVLSSAGTGLCYDSVNVRLGIGTCSPSAPITVSTNGAGFRGIEVTNTNASGNSYVQIFGQNSATSASFFTNGASTGLGSVTNSVFALFQNNTERARFAATTGNLLIGTTTDSNYKLDIAASGSSGTVRVWDQTPTTGVTKEVIRAGAGQSSTNLTEWQNSAGTAIAWVDASFNLRGNSFVDTGRTAAIGAGALNLANTAKIAFSNDATDYGTKDSGIARNAAGLLEINNGTAGTLRDIIVRQYKTTPVAVASLQTCNAGNAGSVAAVNDATAPAWGVAVANGGAAYALVTCNGTNWTVAGI